MLNEELFFQVLIRGKAQKFASSLLFDLKDCEDPRLYMFRFFGHSPNETIAKHSTPLFRSIEVRVYRLEETCKKVKLGKLDAGLHPKVLQDVISQTKSLAI